MKSLSIALGLVVAATTAAFGCASSTSTSTSTGAGGSTSSGTTSGTPVICMTPGAEGELCESNTPATATLTKDCTNGGGKIVTSCPTAGLVGCCTTKLPGMVNEVCHYGGTASQQEANCFPGTWATTP